jgi:hypothetical protein
MSVNIPVDELDLKREALKGQEKEIERIDFLLRAATTDKKALALAFRQNSLSLALVLGKDGRSVVSLQANGSIRVSDGENRPGENRAEYKLFDLVNDPDAAEIKPEDRERFRDFTDENNRAFICVGSSGERTPDLGTFLAEQYYTNPIFTEPSAGEVGAQILDKSGLKDRAAKEALRPYFNLADRTASA